MSIDPGEIRAEPHLEIGLLIQRDADVLIQRWSRRAVQEQPNARRVHHQALVDHFHDFLHALGRSLMESDDPATSQHCLPATVHGEQRWETGWSLPEVVRDYGILRLVIFDYLEEVLEAPLGLREVMAIGLALDESISASVTMYATSRDNYQSQLEAQRAESDRQIQDYLRHKADTLREVDRRKTEFLAILGHEMRNPLAPLSHVVDLLADDEPGAEKLGQIRDITRRQVEQLTRLAEDLLDISRIAQGKIELRNERIDLLDAVKRAVQMSMPHMKARHHQFDVVATPEALWVQGDAARLVQIVGNLLNNAAKYTKQGGRVSLAVERAEHEAVVRVQDSGIGISPDILPHIFELFTQGEWSADESRGGMGIGLALVSRLVALHGGAITAKSAGVNQGSEFEVRLPLMPTLSRESGGEPCQSQQVPPIVTDSKRAPRRVLVVDDNSDVAATLGMLLTAQGHDVRMAHDGPTALQVARDFRPDVALLDLGLPRMDGYEVAQHLREQEETKDILLVALTGYAQEDDRRRSENAGFNLHLIKPVGLETLRAALASC